MADDNELISVGAYPDRDGDPVAVIVVGGVTYARLENTMEEAIETSKRTVEYLERYRAASRLREETVDNTTPRDPSKEN